MDELSESYGELLDGCYDCVDRIVLNAYEPLCYSAGGFRTWWRRLNAGSDEDLDTTHLMRLAGRFSRRLRAFARARGIPLIDCGRRERKHQIAEEYLREHPQVRGIFLILVARAVASVWEVERSKNGIIRNLEKRQAFVNHYSFHIIDPEWGHITIKMSGHPPFGAQVILNGHEYVGCQASRNGLHFRKEGNCFTAVERVGELAQLAEALSDSRTVGRLSQLCERWIYTACLCFGLDLEEQERSGFRYNYSVYQVEYSRNLIFKAGGQMEEVFQGLVDRNRARLGLRQIRTIFGTKGRHMWDHSKGTSQVAITLERPVYSVTTFQMHFGKLTVKGYTKGERVLRFEAIAHNTRALRCGRVLAKFPTVVVQLKGILERALATMQWADRAYISDATLEELPSPCRVGNTRVGGVDIGKARIRAVLAALLTLAPTPRGFTAGGLANAVRDITGQAMPDYDARRAAYDLQKLRGKNLVVKPKHSRRYLVSEAGLRTIVALVVLRDKVLKPLLAALDNPLQSPPLRPRQGRKPKTWRRLDDLYQNLAINLHALLGELHLAYA
jgi:hypothetical protein